MLREVIDATKIIAADDDPAITENLNRLIASLNANANLSPEGEASAIRGLAARVAERAEARQWFRDFPEIADEPIEVPVFLTGLPRSGTTFFQNLFDRDDRFRLIRTWEAISPHPPPGHDPASVAKRREEEDERRAALRPKVAGFEAVHLHDNGGPEECHAYMEQAHGAAGLHNLYDVADYWDWLASATDWQAIYALHKRQLQLLQWKTPTPRWALKYPAHVLAMDAIVALHQEARFVMTHRDPVQVLASLCKLTVMLRGARSASPPDPAHVGRQMLGFLRRHIDGIMAFDAGPEAGRVIHVDYYRLLDNPATEMARVHGRLGLDTPEALTTHIADWHTANPKNARGRNDYALDDYGLDEGAVRAAYADYTTRFAIPREAEGLQRRN
jgi:hypothetical protein